MQNQPLLVVVLGPTGSGKGSIEGKIKALYDLDNSVKFVPVLIDDLIEENLNYKFEINKYLSSVKEQNPSIVTNEELANYITGTGLDESIKKFNNAYFSTRRGKTCIMGEGTMNERSMTCDAKNDEILTTAIRDGKNVIFETTGERKFEWLFDTHKEGLESKDYNIVLAWNVVEVCELITRNANRTKQSIEEFIKNTKGDAPRLPDISPDTMFNKLTNIINTFEKIVRECTENCKHRIVVYDNNKRSSDIIFDTNDTNKQDSGVLRKYMLPLGSVACALKPKGGKKRKTRRRKIKKVRKRNNTKRRRKQKN
jgi:hypothetical protein